MADDQSRLTWALVLSVILHGLLLSALPVLRRAHIDIPQPAPLLDVDVVSLPKPQAKAPPSNAVPAAPMPAPPVQPLPVPKQQIVSPPDAGEEKEPENPRFLSDRNNSVKEEKIHHGEPLAGSPEAKRQEPAHQTAAKAERAPAAPRAEVERPHPNTQLAALPKLDQLLPDAGDLIREGIVKPQQVPAEGAGSQQQASTTQTSKERTDLLRHGDPWKNGGLGGTLDFLPAVRDGDVTMLNTKADQFAPFVRRVAVRVFENFWILLRRSVSSGGVGQSVEEAATVEAVMDKQGNLVSLNTKDRSLNAMLATDRNLQAAVHEAFFDRNPPAGAEANDGNIHFMFDVRVGLVVEPGRGVAGYRALFGAGLL